MNLFLLFLFLSSLSLIHAQQPYAAKTTTDCENPDNSTSQFGYTCNGLNKTCQSFLTFRSIPPYNTATSISSLLGSNPSQISSLNSVSENAVFETDKLILVPITCSCSGKHYQVNTSYVIQNKIFNTYLLIANNTFQGLSTCQAIKEQNNNLTSTSLFVGTRVVVPLRCACPTKNQTDKGVNYLLSFLVTWGQDVKTIATMFGVDTDTDKTLEANSLSKDNTNIYPFTTLLVPLENPPSVSQTLAPPPPSASPPPPPVSPPPSSSDNTWLYVVIGVLGGGVFVLVVGIIFYFVFVRKTKEEKNEPVFTSENFESIEKSSYGHKIEMDSKEFMDSLSDIAKSLKIYTFEEIRKATEDFSPSCWIRGSVYRGKINGDFAAIKKMSGDVSEEINVLSKISHFNLIRLSGVCFDEGNWYLVYEYAVNGPLSDWIGNNNDNKLLSFSQRVQIALDVSAGLNYIHNYTSPPYIHKDIKSGNVLLDGEFRAKIANFGLARSVGGNEGSFALTRHIVGTKGYMAPEYIENGFLSTKLDVYAFGVLVLELLTGKDVSLLYDEVKTNLNEVLYPVINGGNSKEKLRNFMDDYLRGNYPEEMAILMARLVGNCMEKDPSARPGMDEIVQTLSRIFNSSLNWEMSNSISGY